MEVKLKANVSRYASGLRGTSKSDGHTVWSKLKYFKVQNGKKDTWRFWCDSNANGIFDENEKFILDDPSKDNAEIGPRQDSK